MPRPLVAASLLLLALAACRGPAPAPHFDMPEAPAPHPQAAWLAQLVGEWDVRIESTMEPGAEPIMMESRESVRALGEHWVVSEGQALLGGMPFSSLMTLGYDAGKERFVGTWVDSMLPHMWHYEGALDAAGRTLTLDTRGPAFDGSARLDDYRDAIEIVSPDRKILTSSVRQADGSWQTFMRAQYTRRRG